MKTPRSLEEFDENPFDRKNSGRRGRRQTWDDFFPLPYVSMVYAIAARYGKVYDNKELQDEMVQELFLALYKIKDHVGFEHRAFVSATLSNESKQVWRRFLGKPAEDISKNTQDLAYEQTDNIINEIDLSNLCRDVQDAIASLPKFQQWLIQKKFYEDLSYREIVQKYNVGRTPDKKYNEKTLAPFHTQVALAMEKLRKILADYDKKLHGTKNWNPFDTI